MVDDGKIFFSIKEMRRMRHARLRRILKAAGILELADSEFRAYRRRVAKPRCLPEVREEVEDNVIHVDFSRRGLHLVE